MNITPNFDFTNFTQILKWNDYSVTRVCKER